MSELKPCPFCGKMPFNEVKMHYGHPSTACQNRDCGMYMRWMRIDLWNRRAGEEE